MNWNDYYVKREQVKDYVREAEQDRLARQAGRRAWSFDFRCWASTHLNYALDMVVHAWRRARHMAPAGQARPTMADCH